MRIRLRGPSGVSTLQLGEDSTVADLRAQIKEKTSLEKYDIKYGWPFKPLLLDQDSTKLSAIRLDGEQLTITPQDATTSKKSSISDLQMAQTSADSALTGSALPGAQSHLSLSHSSATLPTTKIIKENSSQAANGNDKISLKRKATEGDVPEIPLPDRGATLVMRVMPDDNSCLFRAFGMAVLPGDDLSMPELRALVATIIHEQPNDFTQVVLEQNPDDYCKWIQTEDAWGGAVELLILSKHFEIEICSMDVQSLRIDKFNEGAKTRCILVYSGIHYDTIVQSPSEPPHTKADAPPEFDKRIWDADDDDILEKARQLGKRLQAQHYFTDTGGMAIKCNQCGWIGYGQGQASGHAMQQGHYDMEEVQK
ncbi:MAG: ubiquitin-specific protease otu1 [Claussenomyces sp. TS43310]|nr:MAG: ubiquitin-specific protease otu1 [Claussenomyces sp. TS43310]